MLMTFSLDSCQDTKVHVFPMNMTPFWFAVNVWALNVTKAFCSTCTFIPSSLCDSNMKNIYLSNLNESNIFIPLDK